MEIKFGRLSSNIDLDLLHILRAFYNVLPHIRV